MRANEFITEKWSQKYKSSINCSHPKGFSQKAHCAGKKKHNEDLTMESVCPDCGMCQTHGNLNEIKKGQKDANGFTRCWPGKHAVGTKKGKNGGQVRNCKPNEGVAEGSLNEFDPGEGGFGPFKLYKGSPHHYDHIDTFSSLNAAEEEMEFQKDMAAQEGSIDYYKIIDGTGEEVGGFDPDNAYDDMRRGSKIQNRKPGEQGVAENFADGKGPGRPGDSVRNGIPKGASITWLEKNKHAKGRKGELIRWQLNMRRGHKK